MRAFLFAGWLSPRNFTEAIKEKEICKSVKGRIEYSYTVIQLYCILYNCILFYRMLSFYGEFTSSTWETANALGDTIVNQYLIKRKTKNKIKGSILSKKNSWRLTPAKVLYLSLRTFYYMFLILLVYNTGKPWVLANLPSTHNYSFAERQKRQSKYCVNI